MSASGTLVGAGDVVKWFNTEVCKTSIHRFESGRRLQFPPTAYPFRLMGRTLAAARSCLCPEAGPFAVPEMARRYVAADRLDAAEAAATRRTIELVFATLHRLLGVGVGEHLGYLLTGIWTLLVAGSLLTVTVLPVALGFIGIPIGIALLVGTFEFVGPNEEHGWPLAGTIVPIAYIAWSVWLIALGVAFLL